MNKLKKLYSLIVLSLFIAPLLVACGGDSATATKPASNPTTAAATTSVATTTAAATTKPATTAAVTTAAATTATATTSVATTAAATTSASLPGLTFQTFTSKEGRFLVSLPGQPTTKDQPITADGQAVNGHLFLVGAGQDGTEIGYVVSYADYPASMLKSLGVSGMIDRDIQGISSASIKVSNEKSIQLGDIPGKEFQITGSGTDGYAQVYVDGVRTYQLIASYPAGKVSKTDVQTFFDSFKIIPDTTASTNPTTAAVSSANPTVASGKANDDSVEVKLDQVFYDNLINEFKTATNLNIKFYSSDNDTNTLAKAFDAEAVQNGYKFAQPGATSPVAQGSQLVGIYSKAGQPDLLFSVTNAPVKPEDVKTLWASLDVEANQTAVTNLVSQFKGKKTIAIIVTGNGLLNSLSGGSSTNVSATPASTTAPAQTDPAKGLQEVKVDSVLNDALTKSFPTITGLSVKMFTSDMAATDITNQVDSALKADGYTFAIPGTTAPVKQDMTFTGLYSKAGQPDLLINTLEVPTDEAGRLRVFTELGLSDAAAKSYSDLFKDKKSGMFLIQGQDLVNAILKK